MNIFFKAVLLLGLNSLPDNSPDCEKFYIDNFLKLEFKDASVKKVDRANFQVQIEYENKSFTLSFFKNIRGRNIVSFIKIGDKLSKKKDDLNFAVYRVLANNEKEITIYKLFCDQ